MLGVSAGKFEDEQTSSHKDLLAMFASVSRTNTQRQEFSLLPKVQSPQESESFLHPPASSSQTSFLISPNAKTSPFNNLSLPSETCAVSSESCESVLVFNLDLAAPNEHRLQTNDSAKVKSVKRQSIEFYFGSSGSQAEVKKERVNKSKNEATSLNNDSQKSFFVSKQQELRRKAMHLPPLKEGSKLLESVSLLKKGKQGMTTKDETKISSQNETTHDLQHTANVKSDILTVNGTHVRNYTQEFTKQQNAEIDLETIPNPKDVFNGTRESKSNNFCISNKQRASGAAEKSSELTISGLCTEISDDSDVAFQSHSCLPVSSTLLAHSSHSWDASESISSFTQPPVQEDLISCEKCGKTLAVWDIPEHSDYHFALDLQRAREIVPSTDPGSKLSSKHTAQNGKSHGKRKTLVGLETTKLGKRGKKEKESVPNRSLLSFFKKD